MSTPTHFKGLAAIPQASLYDGIVYQDSFSSPKIFDIISLKHGKNLNQQNKCTREKTLDQMYL